MEHELTADVVIVGAGPVGLSLATDLSGYDTYSRIRLPDLLPLVERAIVEQAQAAFPNAPASQAVVLRWHLRGLNLELVIRKGVDRSTSPVDQQFCNAHRFVQRGTIV
jgi:glycine/D-amino acid oxidase-like deaminating enzyme